MQNICEAYCKDFNYLPEKVLQFGEGNFLRSFADWFLETANRQGIFNGRAVIVQPIQQGMTDLMNQQDCFYTLIMRGKNGGKVVEEVQRISSVSRCINPFEHYGDLLHVARSDDLKVIISNTTEAGIIYVPGEKMEDSPNVSFPAKLTALLYERFLAEKKGDLLILPVELIEKNGYSLKKYVLQYASDWNLPQDFFRYIEETCHFCSTLVDRIVTGYPKEDYRIIAEKLGYDDRLVTTCEPYHCWVIEGKREWAELFPIHKTGLNVIWTDDMTPYRTRKVRILNGAHTMSVLAAYHCGFDIVRDMMQDDLLNAYVKKGLFEQIIPTIDLPKEELLDFAGAVLDRFDNPFLHHRLLDISLNSVSKFKARCLGSLLDYQKITGELPTIICFGLAALIYFYDGKTDQNGAFFGSRNGEQYPIRDSKEVCDSFYQAYQLKNPVQMILANEAFWGENLNNIPGLYERVSLYFEEIRERGMRKAIERAVAE